MEVKIVKSIAGHDAGEIYVVIAQEGNTLLLADGVLRTNDRPKRKNCKHVEPVSGTLPLDVATQIMRMHSDENIRQVLHHYKKCNK